MLFFGKKDKIANPEKAVTSNSYYALFKFFRFKWNDGGWYFSNGKDTALRVNMFFACLKLIANTIACTPLNIINKNQKNIDEKLQFLLKQKPNSYQTAFDFWQKIIFDLLVFGNAFVRIYKDKKEFIAFENLLPDCVSINNDLVGAYYTYSGGEVVQEFAQNEIIHFQLYGGAKPIDLLISPFNVQGKLDKLLENDALPPILKTPEILLQDNQVEEISKDLVKKLSDTPIVLPKDFELLLSNSKSVFDSKFSELKNFTNEEIARFFNIPFGLVGLGGASQPNVLDAQNSQFLRYCINPILRMLENTTENAIFSRNDLMNGYRVKFNRNAIIYQTDANGRADFYKKMLDFGAYDLPKIKALEDL